MHSLFLHASQPLFVTAAADAAHLQLAATAAPTDFGDFATRALCSCLRMLRTAGWVTSGKTLALTFTCKSLEVLPSRLTASTQGTRWMRLAAPMLSKLHLLNSQAYCIMPQHIMVRHLCHPVSSESKASTTVRCMRVDGG